MNTHFRFAVVRSPEHVGSTETTKYMSYDGTGELLKDMTSKARKEGIDHDVAREKVTTRYLESRRYAPNTAIWLKLQAAAPDARESIAAAEELARAGKPEAILAANAALRASLQALFADLFGKDSSLKAILRRSTATQTHAALWEGYVAALFGSGSGKQSLQSLLFWLRTFHAASVLAESEKTTLVPADFVSATPLLPLGLIGDVSLERNSDGGGKVPPTAPSPSPSAADRKRIAELEDAKRQLARMVDDKKTKQAAPGKGSPARPLAAARAAPALTPHVPIEDPWTTRTADFVKNPALSRLLQSLGLTLDGAFVGDLLSRIDDEIALLIGRVVQVEREADDNSRFVTLARHLAATSVMVPR